MTGDPRMWTSVGGMHGQGLPHVSHVACIMLMWPQRASFPNGHNFVHGSHIEMKFIFLDNYQ